MSNLQAAKVWLITGSAHGLGRALSETVLKAGHKLVATARNPEHLSSLVTRYGDQVRVAALDVTFPLPVYPFRTIGRDLQGSTHRLALPLHSCRSPSPPHPAYFHPAFPLQKAILVFCSHLLDAPHGRLIYIATISPDSFQTETSRGSTL
jgi:hypothetical protein